MPKAIIPLLTAYRVPGRERQTVHRLGHQAACKVWSQGGLPCQKVVCLKLPETGPLDLALSFFIRTWEGSMAFKVS